MKTLTRYLVAAVILVAVGSCSPEALDDPSDSFSETRNLLVILWDPHRPDHLAPSKQAVEDLIFGSDPSVAGYFSANSRGKMTLKKAAVLGWYDAIKPGEHYWGPPDTGDTDGDGWITGHTEKWAEAIRAADKDFDYSAYDTNGDKVLSPDELGVLIVIPQNSPFGTNRGVVGKQYPTAEPLVVDGVRINVMAEAYIGKPISAPTVAHELGHLFIDAADMYFWFFCPYAAGSYSIFDQAWALMHMDPYHKLRRAWLEPATPQTSGWQALRSMDETGDLIKLYDPKRGTGEFFLIENRKRGKHYDSQLKSEGLAIWHIIDDQAVYSTLPAPAGVSEEKWNEVSPWDWGRRAIRMIRPETTVFDDRKALWGPADEIRLYWHDGTFSGFTLKQVPGPGAEMKFYLEVSK
jgi:M6 family metalloprotease-like protein